LAGIVLCRLFLCEVELLFKARLVSIVLRYFGRGNLGCSAGFAPFLHSRLLNLGN
jgi:hypothetical protein